MIVSAQLVKRTTVQRYCAACTAPIAGACVTVYGAAEQGDRPYRTWLHTTCVHTPDVKAALARSKPHRF